MKALHILIIMLNLQSDLLSGIVTIDGCLITEIFIFNKAT